MKLTDTQTTVIKAAAQSNGRITEFPPNVRGGARAKIVNALVTRGLAAPDGIGHALTEAGYEAAGEKRIKPSRARGGTKNAAILDLLRRPEGATLAQLVEATGWQPHSVRGTLSILGKKVDICSEKADGIRTYRAAVTA